MIFQSVKKKSYWPISGLADEVTLGAWGLLPNSDYIISIKASNAKGESSPVFLGGSTRLTQNDASWLPINDAAESEQSRMPLLFVIVGILVTLMIMGALLTAILAVRRRREAKLNEIEVQSSSSSNQTPPNDGKTSELAKANVIIFSNFFRKRWSPRSSTQVWNWSST